MSKPARQNVTTLFGPTILGRKVTLVFGGGITAAPGYVQFLGGNFIELLRDDGSTLYVPLAQIVYVILTGSQE